VFALQLLAKAFADLMLARVEMAAVGAPAIVEEPPDTEGLQKRFQLKKGLVFSPPEDIGKNASSAIGVTPFSSESGFLNLDEALKEPQLLA
jgi:hypothetical protein